MKYVSLGLAALFLSALTGPALSQQAQPCSPEQPGRPPAAGLSCQATDEWEWVMPSIVNARKGDLMLTGSCGWVINRLLRQIGGQQYDHVGIITANARTDQLEITHSTANDERIKDSCRNFWRCTDGLPEDRVRYVWPGSVTQTIRDAFDGELKQDPSGVFRRVGAFKSEGWGCEGDLVFPLLATPADPATRPSVEAAADEALRINAHYRFYGFSRGDIGRDHEYNGRDWADGRIATMCSSFVWTAFKNAGIELEGGLEGDDLDRGARVDDATSDGLYLYTEAQRAAAAEWMFTEVYNQARAEAGWVGETLENAATQVANQTLNCFASDNCGERSIDSDAWRSPGAGRTVSPDDMLNWDVYGATEPVLLAEGRYIRRYRWLPSTGCGRIEGEVTWRGSPQAGARVAVSGTGQTTDSGGDGQYSFACVPSGGYELTAARFIDEIGLDTRARAEVSVAEGRTSQVRLSLGAGSQDRPPASRAMRRVTIAGSMRITDDEDVVANERGWLHVDESVVLTPEQPDQTIDVSKCVGDEVRGRLELRLHLHLGQDTGGVATDPRVDVAGTLSLYEGTDCSPPFVGSTRFSLSVGEGSSTEVRPGAYKVRKNGDQISIRQLVIRNDPLERP